MNKLHLFIKTILGAFQYSQKLYIWRSLHAIGRGERHCDQIWPNFAALLKINFWRVYVVFGKFFNLLWLIIYAIGQILIALNGQILKGLFSHLWSLL